MNTKEASEKWKISVRQVQNHCKGGRIKDIQRIGTIYLIPEEAMKPQYKYVYERDITKVEKSSIKRNEYDSKKIMD